MAAELILLDFIIIGGFIGALITGELLDRGIKNPKLGLALPMLIVPLGVLAGFIGTFVGGRQPPLGAFGPGFTVTIWTIIFLAPILLGVAVALMREKNLRWLLFVPLVLILSIILPVWGIAPAYPFFFSGIAGTALTFIVPPIVYVAG